MKKSEIITAVIAAYGAVLSTISMEAKERRSGKGESTIWASAVMIRRWCPVITLLPALATIFLAVRTARATSIVIDFKADRVIILADSRAAVVNAESETVRDDVCKLVSLGGRLAFAETGREGYAPSGPLDLVPEWNGRAEALSAYTSVQNDDFYNVVLRWSIKVVNNFQRFYMADPRRVRALAAKGDVLLDGIFAGQDNAGAMRVYVAKIALDDTLTAREGAAIPIGYAIDPLLPRDEPYSTEAVTQELLDGTSERALKAKKVWERKAKHVPIAKQELRRLEFMIEETGTYDADVHGPINALQVVGRSTNWIQNVTCKGSE